MRRRALLLALLAAPLGAKEAETPFLIFREADPETARLIRDLITEKKLGGQAPDTRRQAREELARIGPWCVPFLATALRKETARVRMNAVLSLMLIRDPRGLPALRVAAKEDRDLAVRRAATLALATFEWGEDVGTLRGLDATPQADWRTIAPSLARLRSRDAPALLKVAMGKLPRDDHDAAAIVLASAIAVPDAPLVEMLAKEERLVQEAAAIGLAVRPLPAARAGELVLALEKTKGTARVLAIHALGAIAPRPAEVHARLLDVACREGDAGDRIAALLELDGREGECERLLKAYRKVEGRNDPVAEALLFALARTRHPEAVQTLLGVVRGGSDQLRFQAAASLLLANGADELDDAVRSAVVSVAELQLFAQRLGRPDPAARAAASKELRELPDLRDFAMTKSERDWSEVNRLMARILDLTPVLLQFDASKLRMGETPLGGGGGGEEGRKAPSGSPDQQDLFDLLLPPDPPKGSPFPKRRPYFGPEDLAVG